MTKKELIKHSVNELITNQNLAVIKTSFAENYIAHAENKDHKGHSFLKRFSKILLTSIPNIKVVNIEFLAEENDTITWQRTLQGTHKKNMMGIPASSKSITWNDMVVSRFEGDKIAEEWVVSELMGQLLLKLGKNK